MFAVIWAQLRQSTGMSVVSMQRCWAYLGQEGVRAQAGVGLQGVEGHPSVVILALQGGQWPYLCEL